MRKDIQQFIDKEFNEDSIQIEISQIESKINTYKDKIEQLKKLDLNTPWFLREGVQFSIFGYRSETGYRSHPNQALYFNNYNDFVVETLFHIDPEFNNSSDSTDFKIISPTGTELKLDFHSVKELPLISEYFERIKSKEQIRVFKEEYESNLELISQLEKEINSEIYLPEHVESLVDRKKHLENNNLFLSNDAVYKDLEHKIQQINEMLKIIDEKLEE